MDVITKIELACVLTVLLAKLGVELGWVDKSLAEDEEVLGLVAATRESFNSELPVGWLWGVFTASTVLIDLDSHGMKMALGQVGI